MPPKDNRRYPKRPLVGVGAILLRGDRILMAQRGKLPLKGWWSLPGGALETGELLVDGIRREVREETGLEVKPVRMFQISTPPWAGGIQARPKRKRQRRPPTWELGKMECIGRSFERR